MVDQIVMLNIASENGLVAPSNKPLPEPMMILEMLYITIAQPPPQHTRQLSSSG